MSAAQTLTGSIAANTVQKWLRAWYSTGMPDAMDLEIVRQMLPSTPYGTGVREIKAPMVLDIDSCEGMLVRNPKDTAEWGIFYNGKASSERRRFTIAHELGHFILHRGQQQSFNCDKESVYSGVDTIRAIEREADDFAIRYSRHDDDLEWLTTVVFSRTASDAWVGVRVECESQHAAARLPPAKKPVVVRTVLESLGGAADGPLPIRDRAHVLANADIDLAAKLIRGDAGCRLPIVYVSAQFQGGHILDVNRLAADLSGMAHVVVEPNRPFSVRLQLEVDSENVYGGTIGIYWPEGGGRRAFFLGGEYPTPGHLAGAIKDEIRAALLNRRPITRCTWAYVRETASRQAIQSLKASGSKAIDDYVKTFDQEIEAKNQRLEDAEREIQRLHNELRKYEARAGSASGGLLRLGRERDVYANEVLGILLEVIEDAVTRVPQDSRRQHVLTSILETNKLDDNPLEGRREQLKKLLRGMSTIDGKMRRELEDMGFSISEDGKHFKLVFQGDDRYTYTLPKSGSDWRGGLNAASDIARLLF